MNWLKKYIAYLKDNPQKYWFKRKIYGWGWIPAKWQGWAVFAIFIFFTTVSGIWFEYQQALETSNALFYFIFQILILVCVLIIVCYITGEPPKWQWGIRKKELASTLINDK